MAHALPTHRAGVTRCPLNRALDPNPVPSTAPGDKAGSVSSNHTHTVTFS
jgi:hypothetical protein